MVQIIKTVLKTSSCKYCTKRNKNDRFIGDSTQCFYDIYIKVGFLQEILIKMHTYDLITTIKTQFIEEAMVLNNV